MPKISVILPCYGVEKVLPKCLDSLLAQTYQDFEVIAVNDASPDGCLAILKDYAAQHPDLITVVDLPENRHLGGARNAGLDVAKGEYVTFVDSDDWLEPETLAKMASEAAKHDADIVDVDCYYFHGEGQPMTVRQNWPAELVGPRTDDVLDDRIARGGGVPGKLIRRSVLDNNDIRFPENTASEDAISSYIWFCAGYIAKVAEPLYVIRLDNTSITRSRNNPGLLAGQTTVQVMVDLFKRDGHYEAHQDAINLIYIRGYYLLPVINMLFKFDPSDYQGLKDSRAHMREVLPHYWQNPYYPRAPFVERAFGRLNNLSPRLACTAVGFAQRFLRPAIPWYLRRPKTTGSTAVKSKGDDA